VLASIILISISVIFLIYVSITGIMFFGFIRRIPKCKLMDMKCSFLEKSGRYDDEIKTLEQKFKAREDIEEIHIKSYDNLDLCGYLIYTPMHKGTVIFFHGFQSNPINDFVCNLQMYIDRGYNILLVDQRAHGNSEGKYITFGIKERFDCVSWCEYISRRFGINKEIALIGISMGASTVLMASGEKLPENVRKIAADCGFTSPKEIITHVGKTRFHLPSILFLPMMELFARAFAGFSFDEYSTYEALEKTKIPILFIHGKEDRYVPPYMSQNGYNVCASKKKIAFFDGARHGLSFFVDKEKYLQLLYEFLDA